MIQQIKELRVRIDGLYQLTNNLQPFSTKGSVVSKWNSQEIEESVKSLLLAKAWLGKLLGELNPIHTVGKNFSSFTVNMMDLSTIKGEYADAEIIPGFNYLYKSRVVFLEETSEDSEGNAWGIVRLVTADPNDHIEISNNPYSSGKKEVKDIELTADTLDMGEAISRKYTLSTVAQLQEMNHIEKVDWLRSEIQSVINDILQYTQKYQEGWVAIYALRAEQHLCEAKMWLGFEFARIKEENL